MKKKLIQYVSVLLSFLAGLFLTSYLTQVGNRDMTTSMAEAVLPVLYAETEGTLYNEMHGYRTDMDGGYMKDSVIAVQEDHVLKLALEKYNAQITDTSYEVRSLDSERLIQDGSGLQGEDDGQYIRYTVQLKDLLEPEKDYLLICKVKTGDEEEIKYYSQITYLGENHMQECLDFAKEFHRVTVEKDSSSMFLNYLEPNGTMDGKSLGYVNIHSRSGPVTWGDMQVAETGDLKLSVTDISKDVAAVVFTYTLKNTDSKETYDVREAIRVRYTASRMFLLAYERTADQIFSPGKGLLTDNKFAFGIQSDVPDYRKNKEENVIGFVSQGQLWCYDFGQNRLSLVYGFEDGQDERGTYGAHDFRILQVEESGSMDFLVYGYMNRGRYEGMSGVLMCHYDALMNTVEEQFFLPSDRPYAAVKEELGKLAVENSNGQAWIYSRGMILQIDLETSQVTVLANDIPEELVQISDSGQTAAWTDGSNGVISLLHTETGIVQRIEASAGEAVRALGFMEEDFIYGTARVDDIRVLEDGSEIFPMYRIIIRAADGQAVREFDYSSKGKYVTALSIVQNRIDLSCIQASGDGGYVEALPEPITYANENTSELLSLKTAYDEVKRNEYFLNYSGTMKNSSLKRPKVKLVLFEGSRTLEVDEQGTDCYLVYSFDGQTEGYEKLADAVNAAYDNMGSVWKAGKCCWSRGTSRSRVLLDGFDGEEDSAESSADVLTACMQRVLKTRQIYTDVQSLRDEGMSAWEIWNQELGTDSCILSGCSVETVLYYIDKGMPVLGMTGTGEAVLIVGYDAQNVVLWTPGQAGTRNMGRKDVTAMFATAGNLYFTCLP